MRCLAVRTTTLPPAPSTHVNIPVDCRRPFVGPAIPWAYEHQALDRFLDRLDGERVVEIMPTHHHLDHVSGAAHLSARLVVPVAAHRETAALVAGRVNVSHLLDEGDRLPYGPDGMRVLHTPGHAPGHVVLVDER